MMPTNEIFTILGWVLFVLALIANYFEFAKKNDPVVADKMKHVGEFAEWAVSLQNTLDKPNADKLASATQEVLNQADKSGIKLTEDMAKGAIEKAIADKKPTTTITSMTKDGIVSVNQPTKSLPAPAPAKPAAKPVVHDLLDDIEVKQ